MSATANTSATSISGVQAPGRSEGGGKNHRRRLVLEVLAVDGRDIHMSGWASPGTPLAQDRVGDEDLLSKMRVVASAQGATTPLLDALFADSNGRVVYRGYVDDPRNTDNAWVETVRRATFKRARI